ncbi:MAG: insulinase family protein [Micromonosporaceae bacterium]|nr:insulinase family protein [Micromonosporaceae bacterium]
MSEVMITETVAVDQAGSTVRRTVLPCGLRILTESIDASRSASFGIWVGVGSRDETPALAGVSHFLEHLLFKGTSTRSALDISAQIEAVGGETNAFTTKEYTCYYARVLDEDLPLAIDVVCDIVTDSVLAKPDIETERGVILEEIAMHDDEPGDEVHDVFAEALYGDHPLGRKVSGTPETIETMSPSDIETFYHQRYLSPRIVVAAAGNLSHFDVVERVQRAFASVERFAVAASPQTGRCRENGPVISAGRIVTQDKDTEQIHLAVGCGGITRTDDRRFALGTLNNVLGAGMSSRLFQEIRERRGLAYSVYSYTSQYADSGLFAVYAGCAPGKADDVLAIIRDELARVAEHGLTESEVRRGQGMFKGSLVLGLEDTGSRMARLGKGELAYGEVWSVDRLLGRVEAVTRAEVHEIAAQLLSGPLSMAVLGPCADHDFEKALG